MSKFMTSGSNNDQRRKYFDLIRKQKFSTFNNENWKERGCLFLKVNVNQSLKIVAQFDETLDVKLFLHWPVTSKPWIICSELEKKSFYEWQMEDLSQNLPKTTDWVAFLASYKAKHRLTTLLADLLLPESINLGKEIFVIKGNKFFHDSPNTSNTIELQV